MPQLIISQFQREYAGPIETFRQVQGISDRDNISPLRRWEGMLVYVLDEQNTYELKGGVDNSNWTLFSSLQDAPSDGNIYARQDGDWVAVGGSRFVVVQVGGTGYNVLKGVSNSNVLLLEVGDEIHYRNPTTSKRYIYYVKNNVLNLPNDFSDRSKLDQYNIPGPAL